MLASASGMSHKLSVFNVRRSDPANHGKESVDIRLYRIIGENYSTMFKKAMEGMLAPDDKEVITGRAEIRAIYKVPKVGNVCGCYVIEGRVNQPQ